MEASCRYICGVSNGRMDGFEFSNGVVTLENCIATPPIDKVLAGDYITSMRHIYITEVLYAWR